MAPRFYSANEWAPAQEAIHEVPANNDLDEPIPPKQNNTTRARSFSMPWRPRPKSLFLNVDEHPMRRGSKPEHEIGDGKTLGHKVSLHSVVRRASHSLKGLVHWDHRRRRGSDSAAFHNDLQATSPTETRPGTSWQRLRQRASFRNYSRSGPHQTSPSNFEPMPSPTFPIPGNGAEPPIIPRHTGATARAAAAAAQNEYFGFTTSKQLHLVEQEAISDRESGVGINIASSDAGVDTDSPVDDIQSKVDFISALPAELAINILSQLDADNLLAASEVSQMWNFVVRNQHVWRDSFLREKTVTYATDSPSEPGQGVGIPPIKPSNNWREIYRVREQLDRHWRTGDLVATHLIGHTDSIYCVQFDESKIITGSRDRTIRIWDMHTLACRLVIGPPDVTNHLSLFLDSNGRPVHSAQSQGVEICTSMPAAVSFPIHHEASILCLQYDDRILVTGSSDSTCIVYNIKSGYRPIRRLQHHSAAVLDVVFDEKHIVTCSKDVSICVWDRETGTLLKQLKGHSGPVNAVQLRGNTIVSCSGDFLVKLWNIETGKIVREFAGHNKGLACSQFSEDGKYIASAGNDKTIRVWDAHTGECLREMKAHEGLVRSLHIDSVSGRLISASYDTDIKVWDLETGRLLLDFPKWHHSWVLAARSDYRRIVSTGQDPKVLIMDFGAHIPGIELLESAVPGRLDLGEHTRAFI